jgi:hypothetical protein
MNRAIEQSFGIRTPAGAAFAALSPAAPGISIATTVPT